MGDPLDPSWTVPDVTTIFALWRGWSDEARVAFAPRTVRYGASDDETLDLIVPRPGAPLFVYFHGGYWRRLHKNDATYVATGFAPHGIATAIVNYGLSPALALEEITAQARRSIAWLREHGAAYGIDVTRIVVGGHSAGGHLAAMCAVDAPVTGVVTMSGLHDIRAVARSFANAWLALDDARAAALSPVLLTPAAPCPVIATTGERETDAFKAQGRDFAAAWRALGCDASYADSTDDDHFTICARLRDPGDALVARIAALAAGRGASERR